MTDKGLKAAAVLLLLFLILALLCSCGGGQLPELGDQSKPSTHFSVVDRQPTFSILVDTDTGVMYAQATRSGTLTLLVNYDGSPRLWPGFDAREDRLSDGSKYYIDYRTEDNNG